MTTPHVKRLDIVLAPSHKRVLVRPGGNFDEQRGVRIVSRALALSEDEVETVLDNVLREFSDRHLDTEGIFLRNFERARFLLTTDRDLSTERQMLIGACFTQEYSLESAALFNPSIVPHPNQGGVANGTLRFMLSLRATGEGHISSIVFRSGSIDADGEVTIDPSSPFVTEPETIPNASYEKALFERKLSELGLVNGIGERVMAQLDDTFTQVELVRTIREVRRTLPSDQHASAILEGIRALAESNYEVRFQRDQTEAERAIFPHSPSQEKGIEDARFTRFIEDDGTPVYYATYTAFDGQLILPQLLETRDFLDFRFSTLNGPAARNKGMALFPRRIRGLYAMLGRQDNENIYLMYSDNVHFWYDPQVLIRPAHSWELLQIGNCGAPIETEAGWLVLSHGVGPMRKYCIGAFLLDREDPSRVIGRLSEPLIKPTENEREGYVPNVVYTCGALLHHNTLLIPYAMADYATGFATVNIHELLKAMK